MSITESPILAASYFDQTVYLVLDTGATASLISLRQAQSLNLKIYPTSHKAIQVDGESDLPITGEVHTVFKRGSASLTFNALVVKHLSVDILAGTSFHKENDVFSRMSKGTIHIGDNIVVQSTPPALLRIHEPNPRTKHFLVQVMKTITILPGDVTTFSAPAGFKPDEIVMIEPNIKQCEAFFEPSILQLNQGRFEVQNKLENPVTIKKNNAAVVMYTTKEVLPEKEIKKSETRPSPATFKPLDDILGEIRFDGNLPSCDKNVFKEAISHHLEVFQPDLPGYNGAYGPVFASFEFASKTRPLPQKLRMPNYGSIQDSLFNLKCQELESSGVIIDPLANEIQPALTHNAWVVKKPSSSHKPWDQCDTKDVRLVVGLDPLNKFLKDPPGKVTKTEQVFSTIAGWQFLGEIDFSDCYFQIKFNQNSRLEKLKLGYLCIRTAYGTRCFSRATMGLLGMDVYQDELTDRIFGDLVVSNKVTKLADNIYFGSNSLEDFQKVFHTILQRCKECDLRIKPSKVSLNVQNSDILGLHWQKGKLSPSKHKLDPLAECDPPKTVRGLRSWLGGVRFNEICLPGSKLSAHSKPLDDQVPAKRSSKDIIEWTATLLHAFHSIQSILKQPISVTVPREGDVIYMATDACTSLPAGGTKLFIKRPGIERFLPSFNFGARLPATIKTWYPCEVEAFFLNKGIEKAAHYVRISNNPAIALTDCKPVYQAKLKLDEGKFSASPKLQSLLTNLSAKRFSIQLLSAKLPSPVLKMVDFNSRHPPDCDPENCSICKDMTRADIFAIASLSEDQKHTLMSVPAWRTLQQSCPDLTKAHALLAAGKPLQSKSKHSADVKLYLSKCSIDTNGLLIVKKTVPWKERPVELLVIPRQFGFTFLKAFHNKLNHPNTTQMKKLFSKQYFVIDQMNLIQKVYDTCSYPCQAMKILPKETLQFSTSTKPDYVGQYYNADVLEESNQKILVIRENLTSYTDACIVPNQTKSALRNAIITLIARLKLSDHCTVRVDNQSSLSSLKNDNSLTPLGIVLETGHPKNVNKNAGAEKAIRELREQLVKISPHGGPVDSSTLARAISFLNDVIRHSGFSAKELLYSREKSTGENIKLDDRQLSDHQLKRRVNSHKSSAKYSSRNGPPVFLPRLSVGDLVFVKSDRSKSKARDSYFIISLDDSQQLATIQKFPMTYFKHHPIKVHYQNLYLADKSCEDLCGKSFNQRLNDSTGTSTEPNLKCETAKSSPKYAPTSSESDSDDEEEEENTSQTSQNPPFLTPPPEDITPELSIASDPNSPDASSDNSLPLEQETIVHLQQPSISDRNYLQRDETIVLVKDGFWQRARLLSHAGKRSLKNGSLYWNISGIDDKWTMGCYLFPGQSWGVLRGPDKYMDLTNATFVNPALSLNQEEAELEEEVA